MKQKDIANIIIIAAFSAVLAVVVTRFVPVFSTKHDQQAEHVPAINADFPLPDQKYFNDQSIDPTQIIHIGDNSNTTPFNGR